MNTNLFTQVKGVKTSSDMIENPQQKCVFVSVKSPITFKLKSFAIKHLYAENKLFSLPCFEIVHFHWRVSVIKFVDLAPSS